MFPENISKNFDKVREIALSNMPIEEKMRLFNEFDDMTVFYKNNAETVKSCFLPIYGFDDYVVNPFGEVISFKGNHIRLLSPSYDGGGYLHVCFYRDGKPYTRKVHRLVADAFLQNPDQMPQLNHRDGNKLNNKLNNLEFCTAKENINHAYRTGLHSKRGPLTKDELDQIVDLLNTGVTYNKIAERFCISYNQVICIATGRSHKELFNKIDLPEKVIWQKRIKCLETGKIYESQKEAAEDLNINNSKLSSHLKSKRSHVGGYHFIRIEEKEI